MSSPDVDAITSFCRAVQQQRAVERNMAPDMEHMRGVCNSARKDLVRLLTPDRLCVPLSDNRFVRLIPRTTYRSVTESSIRDALDAVSDSVLRDLSDPQAVANAIYSALCTARASQGDQLSIGATPGRQKPVDADSDVARAVSSCVSRFEAARDAWTAVRKRRADALKPHRSEETRLEPAILSFMQRNKVRSQPIALTDTSQGGAQTNFFLRHKSRSRVSAPKAQEVKNMVACAVRGIRESPDSDSMAPTTIRDMFVQDMVTRLKSRVGTTRQTIRLDHAATRQ